VILESIVIFSIIFCLVVFSFRSKKKYALSMIPLLIPTGANIISYFFASKISLITPFSDFFTYALINILAVIVSGVLIGIFSTKFSSKTNKLSYLTMCILFNIILVMIFIINY